MHPPYSIKSSHQLQKSPQTSIAAQALIPSRRKKVSLKTPSEFSVHNPQIYLGVKKRTLGELRRSFQLLYKKHNILRPTPKGVDKKVSY